MPFCPNCHIQYVSGTTQCADCGAELTARPSPGVPSSLEALRPAELCQAEDMVQLDLIEAQLRATGIPTVRRPRGVALFVPASRLEEAQTALAGQGISAPLETVGLSELHRLRLTCSECDKITVVDLLEERLPAACSCGHVFDLSQARPMLDRYTDIVRTMAEADFEIELELPKAEG